MSRKLFTLIIKRPLKPMYEDLFLFYFFLPWGDMKNLGFVETILRSIMFRCREISLGYEIIIIILNIFTISILGIFYFLFIQHKLFRSL